MLRPSIPLLSVEAMDRYLPVSRRLGPVMRIMTHRVPAGSAMLHATTVVVQDAEAGKPIVAAGGGLTRRRSIGAAVGEAVERLSLRCCDHSSLTARPFADAATQVDPARFRIASLPRHAGLSDLRPDDALFWVTGEDLRSGAPRDIPAFAVFTGLGAHTPDGRRVYANTSTGAAAARTRDAALLSGLYEVIERDSFSAHWENHWPARVVPWPAQVRALAQAVEERGYRVHVRALPSDTGVPVAIAAIEDLIGTRAAIAFGAAAGADWARAAFRALEEALLTSMWVTDRVQTEGRSRDSVQASLAGLPEPSEHALLYGYGASLPDCAFLFADADREAPRFAPSPVGDARDELAWLVSRIGRAGGCAVAADVTHPAAARLGLTVTRAVVPEFLPLGRGDFRPVKDARLDRIAAALGPVYRRSPVANVAPHPFP